MKKIIEVDTEEIDKSYLEEKVKELGIIMKILNHNIRNKYEQTKSPLSEQVFVVKEWVLRNKKKEFSKAEVPLEEPFKTIVLDEMLRKGDIYTIRNKYFWLD